MALRIVDGGAQGAVLVVFEGDHLSSLGVSKDLFDLTGIDPIVAVKNARAGTDDDTGHVVWESEKNSVNDFA